MPVHDPEGAPIVVRVIAPGFAVADSAPVRIATGTKQVTVEIHPGRGAHLLGRVVVKGGDDPVAGASLRLRWIDPSAPPVKDAWYQNAPRPVVGPVAATTDATGAFDLASLVPGRYDVQVMAPGMEWWTGKVDVPSEGTRIELPRLGAVTGRAHFADGSPAAGVWVMIEGPTYRADTRADADGRFRFDGVPTRGLTLRVGYAFDGTGANVRQLQAKGWKHAGDELDVVTEPALAISGRLVRADGKPFHGSAVVRAFPDGQTDAAEGSELRSDGSFSIRGLAPGRFRVGVEILKQPGDPAYRCAGADGVEAGAAGLSFTVESGLSIEGMVKFPANAAASVRRICARRPGVRGMDASREPGVGPASIDADGRFRIDGLDPGERLLVVQDEQGLDSPWQAGGVARVAAGATNVRLPLTTASTISGVVVFDGRAMPGCDVVARAVGDDADVCAVVSSFAGRFTFVGLDPSKRWDIAARREGLAPARAANVSLGTADMRLELTKGIPLAGRVLRADGSAASKTNVVFRRVEGEDEGWAACDEQGAFEARGLLAGEFVARVWIPAAKRGESGAWVEVGRVRAGDTAVELRLPR